MCWKHHQVPQAIRTAPTGTLLVNGGPETTRVTHALYRNTRHPPVACRSVRRSILRRRSSGPLRLVLVDKDRVLLSGRPPLRDDALADVVARLGRSYITSSMISSMIARRPRAPVFRRMASRAMAASAPSVNFSEDVFHLEELLVLLDQGVARFGEDADERFFVQLGRASHRPVDDRRTPGSFRTTAGLRAPPCASSRTSSFLRPW